MKSMVTCFPSAGKGGSDLGADEAAADDGEAGSALSSLAQALVIGQRAEVDDLFTRSGQTDGVTAGGQQQALVGVLLAQVIHQAAAERVEVYSGPVEVQVNAEGIRAPPDAREGSAFPQPFRERRAVIGRVGFAADQPDGTMRVTWRMPRAAASAAIPPPMMRYL